MKILGLGRHDVLQRDKDSKHTLLLVKNYHQKTKVSITHWPAQRPDFNLTENLWVN